MSDFSSLPCTHPLIRICIARALHQRAVCLRYLYQCQPSWHDRSRHWQDSLRSGHRLRRSRVRGQEGLNRCHQGRQQGNQDLHFRAIRRTRCTQAQPTQSPSARRHRLHHVHFWIDRCPQGCPHLERQHCRVPSVFPSFVFDLMLTLHLSRRCTGPSW